MLEDVCLDRSSDQSMTASLHFCHTKAHNEADKWM